METPKNDNVINLMNRIERLKEKAESKKSIAEELLEADFTKFKEMVAYAIGDIYKLLIIIADLRVKSANQHLELQNMLLRHRHDGEIIIWPEEMLFVPTKDS